MSQYTVIAAAGALVVLVTLSAWLLLRRRRGPELKQALEAVSIERLRNLLPEFAELRANIESYPVDDAEIRTQIAKDYARYGEVWCPHTATGFWVYDHLPPARRTGRPWIVSATAHPAKFETIVEPVIGRPVPVPPSLAELLDRPTASTPLAPRLEQFVAEIDAWI